MTPGLPRVATDPWEPRGDVAMKFAGTVDAAPATLREALDRTHDELITELGDRRRSGIRWAVFGALEGVDVLKRHGLDPDGDLTVFLREHPFGQLVIAMAEADR
ncbi:MAG: hypothetical protein ACRDIX_07260 [Actinomycetota bacterium]